MTKKSLKLLARFIPRRLRPTARCFAIMAYAWGHSRSVSAGVPLDGDGCPLPWYTYPAIEYLKLQDLSRLSVFEYGAGYSTRFWAYHAARVVAVEDDPEWFEKIRSELADNTIVELQMNRDSYVNSILNYEPFDVIVIDGSHRSECAKVAASRLKAGGLVILDNSDWHATTAQQLADCGLLEVTMTGFGPVNPYTWTTSLFFDRAFSPTIACQPGARHVTGGLAITRDD